MAGMANRITTLCIDATDPGRLAEFWCAVLDWQVTEQDEQGVCIEGAGGPAAPSILFLQVPDGLKSIKNRLHLDVNATDRDQAAELERLLALGATVVDIGQGEVSWHVLADPEGNEFCLLRERVEPIAAAGAPTSAASGEAVEPVRTV
jgi:predicted enzyme related to lactoylglutathione lyase